MIKNEWNFICIYIYLYIHGPSMASGRIWRSPPKPAAANLGRRAGARAARSQRSVTWRQSAVTVRDDG